MFIASIINFISFGKFIQHSSDGIEFAFIILLILISEISFVLILFTKVFKVNGKDNILSNETETE